LRALDAHFHIGAGFIGARAGGDCHRLLFRVGLDRRVNFDAERFDPILSTGSKISADRQRA
jgi:hypothetical protein